MKQKPIDTQHILDFMKSHGFDPDVKKIYEEVKELTYSVQDYMMCPTKKSFQLIMEEFYDVFATISNEANSRGVSIYDEFMRKQKMTGEKYGNI